MAVDTYSPRSFMATLPAPDRDALLAIGHHRSYARGELLIRSGDRADSAIVVRSGQVKIHKNAADGAEVLLGLSGPGDLLGELSVLPGTTRSASATALNDVASQVISVPDLRAFLGRHPEATLALLDLTLHRLHIADRRRVEFATSESLARVSSRLVELAERFGSAEPDGTVQVAMPINQEELASWSASSKESTARALRTLRDLGLIETHRMRMAVRDLARLRSHAGD